MIYELKHGELSGMKLAAIYLGLLRADFVTIAKLTH